jgi:hypothetical protein
MRGWRDRWLEEIVKSEYAKTILAVAVIFSLQSWFRGQQEHSHKFIAVLPPADIAIDSEQARIGR